MNLTFLAQGALPEHHWLEYLSWGANVVIAIAAIFALVQVIVAIKAAKTSLHQSAILVEQVKVASDQLLLSTKEIELRSKREALSMALEQCKRFASEIGPHLDDIYRQAMALKYAPPAGPVNHDFPPLMPGGDPKALELWGKHEELRIRIIQTLNELESFAMYFSLDLADEQAAFVPIGQTLCHACEYFRSFIGAYRPAEKVKLYKNLVALYQLWKPRLERTALEEQGKLLEQKKQQLPADKPGIPLGTKIR